MMIYGSPTKSAANLTVDTSGFLYFRPDGAGTNAIAIKPNTAMTVSTAWSAC